MTQKTCDVVRKANLVKKTRIRTLFLASPKGGQYPAQENEEWPIYQGEFSHESVFERYKAELKAYEA